MRMTTDLSQNNGKWPRTVFINRCKQLSLFVFCKHRIIQDMLQDMSNDKCPCSFFRLGFVCDGHACKTKERQITFCKKTGEWQMAFAILQFSFSNSVNCHYIMCSCYVHVRCCKPRAWKLHLQHMGTWQIATIMFRFMFHSYDYGICLIFCDNKWQFAHGGDHFLFLMSLLFSFLCVFLTFFYDTSAR